MSSLRCMRKVSHLLHGRPISKFWEFDKDWDGIFLLGHHAMNGTEDGNLNHTYSSKNIVNMYLNGEKIGEIGIEIYLAGWFGSPDAFINYQKSTVEKVNPTTIKVSGKNFLEMWKKYFLR